jgi:predicted nucleic acid-binding protein
MLLIDTDVMVDVLREHPPALAWLRSLGSDAIGVPGLVAMELLQGCRNQAEQRRVVKVLRPYALCWPSQQDCQRAYDDFSAHHLTRNLGVLDALVAETAVGMSAGLATFNERHYAAVGALGIVRPYER